MSLYDKNLERSFEGTLIKRVRVKHALRRPRTPSGALTRPQLSQTQNHTPSLGCKTPWGSTRCTPSFRPLPPPIKLRAPFTLKGKTRPQLFLVLRAEGAFYP